ncbi:hypothetical protein GNZ13_14860 [Paraburkholderia sp. 5N]|uniref:Uncharacterized protein n=1 Tax=Paraburkholderia elongata TaxID=2675747 RepID=A0A972NNJ5_9BURK|nr:hypothetical protein [Paraburkholderia elongata]
MNRVNDWLFCGLARMRPARDASTAALTHVAAFLFTSGSDSSMGVHRFLRYWKFEVPSNTDESVFLFAESHVQAGENSPLWNADGTDRFDGNGRPEKQVIRMSADPEQARGKEVLDVE